MKVILVVTLVLVLLAASGVFFVKQMVTSPSSDPTTIDFLISKGSSVTQIANNLYKEGLIKNPVVFKLYVKLTNKQNKLQAGEFSLSKNLSLEAIIDSLQKGPKEIWVTIPEGLRREEIASKFADSLGKDETFKLGFIKLTESKEGYLFPDTYLFPKAVTAEMIVNKMTSIFSKKITEVTFEELIMASLLERETFDDSEKPVVAGILYKRAKNGWPLQIDATVQYAKDSLKCKNINDNCKYWEPIFSSDKEINSKYNTYKYIGFPPGPIANPGLSSINAAIAPQESEYWYYIHDNEGKIHFAKTLEEHNQNINKYLK